MKKLTLYSAIFIVVLMLSSWLGLKKFVIIFHSGNSPELRIEVDVKNDAILVYRASEKKPLLTHVCKPDFRPYLHPLLSPDGKSVLTEYSPGHHKHQTGIYWGFTRVNGRDYFHNPGNNYWKKIASKVSRPKGKEVRWQTVYDLLDEHGNAVLTETQTWTMREENGKYFLTLEWNGEAKTDVTIGKYDYGGLFVRMPWKEGIKAEVINAARQKNDKAEGQRAMWVDVGMQVEGRNDLAHIAVFDHPENRGFPQSWRVDGQLGIGPATSRGGDWKITKGETEVIRYQLVVYAGELDDVVLSKSWSEFSGKNSTADLWQIAQKEGREAKFLNAKEAVEAMTVQPGFNVNAWASEPMITQPMAFCWDDRGRMWIAENRDYESRGHGFSNAGNSRILILEDTDKDGVADSKKVFMEGIAFPAALAVGFDGVFVGAPPNLLFVPDKNHDDKADEDAIEVRLTGWGIRDRHETLNSFTWGPDGWLYGLQGFATPSKVRKPVGKGKLYKHKDPFPDDILSGEGVDINGGVWRYHPVKDKFEVVAHGFSNPWGIDFDAKGQMLMSACVIPHLWHVIPGGIYHRQGGQHFNPYVYNDIKTITDHSHRSAHGGARVYLSDAFPASQYGRLFMANIHEHAVLSDIIEPKGSGFVGHHGDDFLMANNAQWVGFSMELGPEGALYVLDWHDADICGKEVLNGETGRIYRIAAEKSLAENFPGRYSDLTKMSDEQLVGLQTSKSDWHARRARLILQYRSTLGTLAKETHNQLKKIFEDHTNPDVKLRAMWALHVTGGLKEKGLMAALNNNDPHIRAWAIQLLGEDKLFAPEAISKFAEMAATDNAPVVRLYLASALQRMDLAARWKIAEGLVRHKEDENDHNLPKMVWFGIEPLIKEHTQRALALAAQSEIPMLAEYISRRTVDAGGIESLIAALDKMGKNKVSVLEGMRDGLEGRSDVKAPAGWKSAYLQLKTSGGKLAKLAQEVAEQFGDIDAVNQSLLILKNTKAPAEQRRKALQLLVSKQRQEIVKEIPALLNSPELKIDAIRAISGFENDALGKMLIERFNQFKQSEKNEMLQTMSSRPKYGWMLTEAISRKTISKNEVPPYVARQLLRVVGSGFVEVWGPIEENPTDKKAYTKYQKLLSDRALSSANLAKGKTLFMNSCGPCHKLYGEGGNIGPDITGSNRSNLDYLLFNILDPSGEIQDDYKMVVVTTRNGRTYTGNVRSENDRQLTLKVVGQEAVIINKSDIQSREVTPVSMMPTGLLNGLTDAEVVNLIGYLRNAAPGKK